MDVADDDELLILHSRLEKLLFDISHKTKKSLSIATDRAGASYSAMAVLVFEAIDTYQV
jgi:hypothetical protein